MLQKQAERVCANCGTMFTIRKLWQIYCCRKCQQKKYQDRAQRRLAEAKLRPTPAPSLLVNKQIPARTWPSGYVAVDLGRRCLLVSGVRVVISIDDLEGYLQQLKRRPRRSGWMCRSCGGETAGDKKPARCQKCGSSAFEMVGANQPLMHEL